MPNARTTVRFGENSAFVCSKDSTADYDVSPKRQATAPVETRREKYSHKNTDGSGLVIGGSCSTKSLLVLVSDLSSKIKTLTSSPNVSSVIVTGERRVDPSIVGGFFNRDDICTTQYDVND